MNTPARREYKYPPDGEFPHVFGAIDLHYAHGVDYVELVLISKVIRSRSDTEALAGLLGDAVRKMTWTFMTGRDVSALDDRLCKSGSMPGVLSVDLGGQGAYQKFLLEFIAHAKASVDALALFINALLRLGLSGGKCDLKRIKFRDEIKKADPAMAKRIDSQHAWLREDTQTVRGLAYVRDNWIHKFSPPAERLWPPTVPGFGSFAIPLVGPHASASGLPTPATHISTDEFVEHHYSNLSSLISSVVAHVVNVEREKHPEFMPSRDEVDPEITIAFPIRSTGG